MGSHDCHLKLEERRKLPKWLEAKMPVSEIADRLGRDPSTIYRAIKRNRYTDDELPELNGWECDLMMFRKEHGKISELRVDFLIDYRRSGTRFDAHSSSAFVNRCKSGRPMPQ